MKVKVVYNAGFTKNLGNFNNVKPEFGLEAIVEVDSLDEVDAVKEQLTEKVDEWLFAAVDELAEALETKV